MDRRRAVSIIPEIYKATVDSANWDHVLELLARFTGSELAVLYFHDKAIGVANTVAYYGCVGEMFPNFDGNFTKLDSLFDQQTCDCNKVETLSQIFFMGGNDSMGSSSTIDANNLKKNTNFHLGRVQFIDNDKQKAALAVLRREDQGAWAKGEIRLISEIVPHLKRALDIHSEFTRLRFQQDALLNGLDRLVVGLILYDEYMNTTYINPAAIEILKIHPALSFDNGLKLRDVEANRNLQKTISDMLLVDPEDSWTQSVAIGVTHPDVEAPLPLLVTPLSSHQLVRKLEYKGAKVAVFLSDSNERQPISVSNLVSAYSLTPSEARVAIGIANGESIDDIANMACLSPHTVKTQLKATFRKTGATRQNELTRLLLTGPFAHRRRSKVG
ncbi:MAG: DNA-binding CsgD family transcriptional regulator [Gammaproteobacteria bacterium]|jgi:DNA-binding CsgD family transcriptional regulator